MARFNVLLDFTVKGAEATVKAVGDVADKAQKSGKVFASLEVGVENYIKKLAGVAAAAVTFQKIYDYTRAAVIAFSEAEQVTIKFEQAIKSSSNEAGHNSRQLLELSKNVADLAGIDDKLVVSAESVLLSFNRISQEAFPRAVQAAADLSAAMGYELNDSISIVGKSLQQPEKASYLLAKAKIFLTQAQKAEIEQFVNAGEVYKAQDVILNQLARTVGGSAAAAGDTLKGSFSRLERATGDLSESLGEGLAPSIREVSNILSSMAGNESILLFFKNLGSVVGGVGSVFVKSYGTLLDYAAGGMLAKKVAEGKGTLEELESYIERKDAELAIKRGERQRLEGLLTGEDSAVEFSRKQAILKLSREIAGEELVLMKYQHDADALRKQRDGQEAAIAEGRKKINAQNLADALKQIQLEGGLTAQQLARISKLHTAQEALWQAEEFREQNRQSAERNREEAAKKAIEDARRAREEAVRALEALRSPQAKLSDQLAEWRKRFREGIIDAKELEAALQGMARANPLDRIKYERPADVSPQELAQVMSVVITPIRLDLDKFRMTEEQLADLRAEANQMTAFLVTEEERRNDLLKDAEWLLGAGALSQEKYNELVEHFAKVSSQEAIISIEMFWDSLLGNAGSALNYLADQFGGFFNYLAGAVNALQRARSFGSSVSGVASAFTQNSSTIATAGYVGTVVAIFAEVYSFVDKMIEKNNQRKFGNAGGYAEGEFGGGRYFDEQSQQIRRSIRSLARSIEDALGIFIDDMEEISISVRNDGERVIAYVAGELVGIFGSVEEAMKQALLLALKRSSTTFRGLSDLMKQGLGQFGSPDLDEFQRFMGDLREISNLGLSQGGVQLQDTLRYLERLMETLSRVREVTPAVLAGYEDIGNAIVGAWQQWSDSITGRQRSASEELEAKKQEAALFNARKAMYIAELQLQKLELAAKKAALMARLQFGSADIGIARDEIERGRDIIRQELMLAELYGEMRNVMLNNEYTYLKSLGEIDSARTTMTSAAIEAIAAQLAAIDAIIANLPTDIDPGSIRLPGAGGGRRQQRETLEDELRGIIRDAMPELSRALLEGRERIAELEAEIARLGPDAGLASEALAALRANLGRSIQEEIDGILSGGSDWSRQRQAIIDHWQEVRDAVQEHLDATGVQLVSFFEITEAEAQQLADITRDLLGSLGVPYFDLQQRMIDFDETMANLFQAFEDGSLDATQLMIAVEAMGDQIYATLLGGMAQYIQDAEVREQVERQLRELEYDAKKAIWAAEIEFYRLRGQLTQEEYDFLQGVLGSLPTDLPIGGSGGGGGGGGGSNQVDQFFQRQQDAIQKARDLLNRYLNEAAESGLSPFQRDLRRLNADFDEIRRVLGNTAEVQRAYAASLKALHDRYLQSIRDFRRELALGEDSGLTPAARFLRLQAELQRLMAAVNQGDLSQAANIPAIAQQMMQLYGQLYGGATGGGPSGGYANFVAWIDRLLASISGGGPALAGSSYGLMVPANDSRARNAPQQQSRQSDPLISEVRALRSAFENGMAKVEAAQLKTANAFDRREREPLRKAGTH